MTADLVVIESPSLLQLSELTYVTETATGLLFRPDTPIEVWGALVERLQRQAKVIEWALADALIFGERYGEDYAQWVEETGLKKRTLQNIARIGREIPPARRRADVSFSHHAEVITLPLRDQETLLDRAESAGMTRYELRDAVRERKREMEDRSVTHESLEWKPTRDQLTDEARLALDVKLSEMGARHRVGFESGWIRALVWADCLDAFRREGSIRD